MQETKETIEFKIAKNVSRISSMKTFTLLLKFQKTIIPKTIKRRVEAILTFAYGFRNGTSRIRIAARKRKEQDMIRSLPSST